jgi:hypothetical protein
MKAKATEPQKALLKKLGAKFSKSLTKKAASRRIERVLAAKNSTNEYAQRRHAELDRQWVRSMLRD